MKKPHPLLVLNLLITLAAFTYLFFARNSEKMAYVDSNTLLSKYQGMIEARGQYQKLAQEWQSRIDTLALEIQEELKRHEKELSKMTRKEKDLSEKLIKNKQQQLINYQQSIQEKAASEDAKMTQNVVNEVNTYLEEYGKKHTYQIIFAATNVGNILYAHEAIDITEEVLEGLNRRYNGE